MRKLQFAQMMSSGEIYFFLKVFKATARAIYQPVILPSFSKERLQVINFLQVVMSPESRAHYSEPRKASSPKFSVGWFGISAYCFYLTTVMFWSCRLICCNLLMVASSPLILFSNSLILQFSFSWNLLFFSACISVTNLARYVSCSCSMSPSMIFLMRHCLFGNSFRYRVSILLTISIFPLNLARSSLFFSQNALTMLMISSTMILVVDWYLVPSTNSFWQFQHIDTNKQIVSRQINISVSPIFLRDDALLKKSLKGRIPTSDLRKQSKNPTEVTVRLSGDSQKAFDRLCTPKIISIARDISQVELYSSIAAQLESSTVMNFLELQSNFKQYSMTLMKNLLIWMSMSFTVHSTSKGVLKILSIVMNSSVLRKVRMPQGVFYSWLLRSWNRDSFPMI